MLRDVSYDAMTAHQWWSAEDRAGDMMVFAMRVGVHPQIAMAHVRDVVSIVGVDERAFAVVLVVSAWVHGKIDDEDVIDAIDEFERTSEVGSDHAIEAMVVRAVSALASWWMMVYGEGVAAAHPSMLTPLREFYWHVGETLGRGRLAMVVRRGIPYACLACSWIGRMTGEDMNQAEG